MPPGRPASLPPKFPRDIPFPSSKKSLRNCELHGHGVADRAIVVHGLQFVIAGSAQYEIAETRRAAGGRGLRHAAENRAARPGINLQRYFGIVGGNEIAELILNIHADRRRKSRSDRAVRRLGRKDQLAGGGGENEEFG